MKNTPVMLPSIEPYSFYKLSKGFLESERSIDHRAILVDGVR